MDWRRYHLVHETPKGTWAIRRIGDRFHVFFEDENLGDYPSPSSALDDLVLGHTDWPASEDPSEAGLPEELSDWTVCVARSR